MTPEEAAAKAAENLERARMHAADPERAATFVAIADGWTRLHTALKMGQTELVELEPEVSLSPDETRAVLDSMKTNDHCTIAYDSEIQAVRGKIEAFVGDRGLVLRVAGPVTSPCITNP